jgi:hypothetical protein
VIAAAGAIHALADRVGHVPMGESGPAWLRGHRCDKLLGALMWEAVGDGDGPVLTWLCSAAEVVEHPITYNKFFLPAKDAAHEGFKALR